MKKISDFVDDTADTAVKVPRVVDEMTFGPETFMRWWGSAWECPKDSVSFTETWQYLRRRK